MSGRYDRGLNLGCATFDIEGELRKVNLETIYQILGITSIIRVVETELPQSIKPRQLYLHYGLPIYDSEVGQDVIVAPILSQGKFRDGAEVNPVLGLSGSRFATVVEYDPCLKYTELNPRWFYQRSIGDIDSVEKLQAKIPQRYADVLGKDPETLLLEGVSRRRIRMGQLLSNKEKAAFR